MFYFDGYDIYGNSCRVQEPGGGIGFVMAQRGGFQAIRLAPSVYMATNGEVYASTQQKCSEYSTIEWQNWARREMRLAGWHPEF